MNIILLLLFQEKLHMILMLKLYLLILLHSKNLFYQLLFILLKKEKHIKINIKYQNISQKRKKVLNKLVFGHVYLAQDLKKNNKELNLQGMKLVKARDMLKKIIIRNHCLVI